MSNITKFSSAGLPAVGSLASSLRSIANEVGDSVGVVILKMDKTGTWVFGADQTEVEPDSEWAINPYSFVHGYIAWAGDKTPAAGTMLGEKMVPVSEPLPEVGPAPEHAPLGWQIQIGFSVKCLSGEDEGMEARFTTTSTGGKRAVSKLAVALAEQVDRDQSKPVAVIKLETDSYKHSLYGKVFVPVLNVVRWISLDGETDTGESEPTPAIAAEPQAEAAPEAPAEGGRRRRRAA